MLKHAIDQHEREDPEKIEFRMKVLKYHRTAFERQVSESVEIRNNTKHNILNSKGEYNRCALPRLGLKIGTKEYSTAKEDEEREEEKEGNIEEKIRMMRKAAGKKTHGRQRKEDPAPKRRKLGSNNEFESKRITSMENITPLAGEKRSSAEDEDDDEQAPPPRKMQKKFQQDIRLFIKQPTARQRLTKGIRLAPAYNKGLQTYYARHMKQRLTKNCRLTPA
jgi:hypothetical protein